MTGDQIRDLRQRAGLEPKHLALLLGVANSTVYRWEKAGAAHARVEPLQEALLTHLELELRRRSAHALRSALLLGGCLSGLRWLLSPGDEDGERAAP